MVNFLAHRAFEEAARLGRIVEVIGERIGDRFGDDGFRRKMRDSVDLVLRDKAIDECHIAEIAENEGRVLWHGPTEPGRQIIEDDHALACVEKRQNHVAADISRATYNQNAHAAFTSNVNLHINKDKTLNPI